MTANDFPFKSAYPADIAEADPSALPDHIATALAEEARLDLLLPQDLPAEHALSEGERSELRAVLTAFLEALRLSDPAASLSRIEALLARFNDVPSRPAPIGETGIPVNAAQVADFDGYFRVSRIASDAPAHALVRGLLQVARANMVLFRRVPDLPQARIAQQIAGFAEYTHLLARSFDLGELS